jgi:transcription elongation GreA/GreB family factor
VSKAFMPDDAAVPEAPLVPARPSRVLPITPAGHARLVAERAALGAASPRAAALDRVLASVEVVAPALLDGGAGFGCQVTVEDEHGAKKVYALVGPDEVDAAHGQISADSPIGRAILRGVPGDVVHVPRGGRQRELTIVGVRVADT